MQWGTWVSYAVEYQSPFCAVRYPKDRDREDMDAASVLDHMDLSYCQESARRKRCGRGGEFLKSFMHEYKTKKQGTQVDTTHVGRPHARSVFSTRALFTPTPLLLKTAMLLKTANIIWGQSSRKDPP